MSNRRPFRINDDAVVVQSREQYEVRRRVCCQMIRIRRLFQYRRVVIVESESPKRVSMNDEANVHRTCDITFAN